jgi:hypothetical protein
LLSIVLRIVFPLIPIVLAPAAFLSLPQGLTLQTASIFHCRSPVVFGKPLATWLRSQRLGGALAESKALTGTSAILALFCSDSKTVASCNMQQGHHIADKLPDDSADAPVTTRLLDLAGMLDGGAGALVGDQRKRLGVGGCDRRERRVVVARPVRIVADLTAYLIDAAPQGVKPLDDVAVVVVVRRIDQRELKTTSHRG